MVAENGNHATYNQVVPQFWSSSLTDEFRPTDKWLFNLGIRLDSFTFNGSNTDYGAARNMWTNAFNIDNCVNNVSGAIVPKAGRGNGGLSGRSIAGVLPERPGELHVQRVAAAYLRYLHGEPDQRRTFLVRPVHASSELGVRAVQHPARRSRRLHRQQLLCIRPHDAGLPDRAADLDQLRHFVGTSVQKHGHVDEADAVLAPNAEPDSAVLPRPEDWVRFRLERRQPAQPRSRVPVPKGRLLEERLRGSTLVCVHGLVHQVRNAGVR